MEAKGGGGGRGSNPEAEEEGNEVEEGRKVVHGADGQDVEAMWDGEPAAGRTGRPQLRAQHGVRFSESLANRRRGDDLITLSLAVRHSRLRRGGNRSG